MAILVQNKSLRTKDDEMLFSKPIDQITYQDIETFCGKAMTEGVSLDYKENIPKELERTISAFANTYGGLILIGIEEDAQGKPKIPIKGIPFQRGLHETIINIILSTIMDFGIRIEKLRFGVIHKKFGPVQIG
jgi:predicted HTH transcriptional regulator